MDPFDVAGGIDQPDSAGCFVRDLAKTVGDADVEGVVQLLVAVRGGIAVVQPDARLLPRQVEHQGQVRRQRGRPDQRADEGHDLRVTAAQPIALIGQRRIEIAVADDQPSLGQGRLDGVLDMIEACGDVQKDLGP